MARGPLPDPNARRRNAPTIPTTSLPATGRKGRAPAVPEPYSLKKAGRAWWTAAWKTPQSTNWDAGAIFSVARRATLEDDLAILDRFDHFDIAELLGMEENETIRQLQFVIGRLKSMAGGRIAVMREMRELDMKLGLNPEALAKLRWTIVEEADGATTATAEPKSKAKGKKKDSPRPTDRRARLTALPGGRAAAS